VSDLAEITPNGTEYDLELNKESVPTTIKIGGTTEKFVPNINASKWNDEAWLNINCPVSVADEKEVFDGEKVEIALGDQIHRFFEIDGKLEYEIEISRRPASDQIEFLLTHPEGLRFTKQKTLYEDWLDEQAANPGNPNNLTWEQYQQVVHRPENIVGSYAVYWKKENNQYKTGKFCHIYRISLKDADEKIVWADMEITPIDKTHARLVVTISGKWLDEARYPVKIDPILGFNEEGESNYGSNTLKDCIWDTTDGTGGAINTYYCILESVAANTDVKIGVYNCEQVAYDPKNQTLVEQALIVNVEVGENSVAGSGSNLAADTYYEIAWLPEDGATDIYYDSDGNCGYYRTGQVYADQLISPFEAGSSLHTRHCSMWVDYGGAVGVAPTGTFFGPLCGPFGGVL